MRFLVDMNLSPRWGSYLRDAGHDALHWSEVGEADAPDAVLMQWAASRERIVITNDLDFSAILTATQRRKPSVIQVRAELLTPDAIGTLVLRAAQQTEAEMIEGALVPIDVARTRIRVLPLGS